MSDLASRITAHLAELEAECQCVGCKHGESASLLREALERIETGGVGNVRPDHTHFIPDDPWESPFSLALPSGTDEPCDDAECFGTGPDGRGRDYRELEEEAAS